MAMVEKNRIKRANDGLGRFAIIAAGLLVGVLAATAAAIVALDALDGRPMSEPIAVALSFFWR